MTATPPKKSDLGVRTLSAIVMVAVAGAALWLGGWVWTAFVALVALGVLWEWAKLAFAIAEKIVPRIAWVVFGLCYIGGSLWLLSRLRENAVGHEWILIILVTVVSVDVGAYFTGRRFGGPKIAPDISPSKTWSGLAGGMIAAAMVGLFVGFLFHQRELAELDQYVAQYGQPSHWAMDGWQWGKGILGGCAAAIVAQSGDFLESWMKRRAGVKDSGNLLPGHGGVFDRVDGLLALVAVFALYWFGVSGGSQ